MYLSGAVPQTMSIICNITLSKEDVGIYLEKIVLFISL
ncbi:hypothetical protein CALK_0811 [Chitinivibrio alkaliphilus ACht1]|uniref:Uncharacterized protein n=1 Tax=Chitinivibrio alkaliphilus ACht1 TaxID=1313304 RepID=U7D930_9BACT|nr:hypothetical protein CALK_0811 [Chitinivibrio alkaliphilus ACht1]